MAYNSNILKYWDIYLHLSNYQASFIFWIPTFCYSFTPAMLYITKLVYDCLASLKPLTNIVT